MPFGIGRGLKKATKKYGKYVNPVTAFSVDPKGTAKGFLSDAGLSVAAGSNKASKLRAKIAREQWEDYKTRFQPLENILLGYAGNKKQFVSDAVGQAQQRVDQAYGGGQGLVERRLQSYGLQITPEVQARIAKKLDYDHGLAKVQASNMASRQANDQVQGIIGGGLSLGARGIR